MEKHGGEVPDNFPDLEALAGVGHKTASVVLAVAFKHATFPVDTHIFRSAVLNSLFQHSMQTTLDTSLLKSDSACVILCLSATMLPAALPARLDDLAAISFAMKSAVQVLSKQIFIRLQD